MDIIEIIAKATDSFEKFLDYLVAAWRRGDRRKVLLERRFKRLFINNN